MSDDKEKVPGKFKRMVPKPLDDKPRPIVESWVKRFEHKAEAGAVQAHNEMKAALVRNRELDAEVVKADTDLERAKSIHANVDDLKALDKAELEAELKETENRREIALAKANEVVADSEARKARAVAEKADAEADAMASEYRKEKMRVKLAALKKGHPRDDFDKLAAEGAKIAAEIEALKIEIDELQMKDDDTEAQSQVRAKRRILEAKKDELAEINRRLDEFEGDAD